MLLNCVAGLALEVIPGLLRSLSFEYVLVGIIWIIVAECSVRHWGVALIGSSVIACVL